MQTISAALTALCVGLGPALAAPPMARAEEPSPFQVAVHAGYRAGGGLEDDTTGAERDLDDSGSLALAFELRYGRGDDRFLQLWYARQETDIDDGVSVRDVEVEYLHIGGTVPFGELGKAQPYFAAGLGATRFSASGANATDRTRFSGSMGVGLELPLAVRAALRIEARGYLTLVDSDSAFLCRSDDGSAFCRIIASGSTIFQGEVLAGLALRF